MANISVTPQGSIYLVKTPLENDYKNTFTFSSLANQSNYFDNLSSKILAGNDYTYIKKDNKIRVGINIDEIINYNYLFYNNAGFTTKRYYCFIDRMEYVNENCTDIYIETDVFQTWYFQIVWNRCFVEREHVNDDTLGLHTVAENVETGEYKIYSQSTEVLQVIDCVILASSVDLATLSVSHPEDIELASGKYNGVYSGVKYYRYDTISELEIALNALNECGMIDKVVCLFMCSSTIAPVTGVGTHAVNESDTPVQSNYFYSRIADLDGYTPKNKKLLTYPYCYIRATNGIGNSAIYRQEVWDTDVNNYMHLKGYSALVPGGSTRLFPHNYNGTEDNIDEGFSLAKYPQLSWNADLYTNWEITNGANLFGIPIKKTDLGVMSGMIGGITGLKKNKKSEMEGSVKDIFSTLQEQYQHQLDPASLQGSLNSADVSAVSGLTNLRVQKMGIKREFAEIIDNYFSMFGYKVNVVKVPNITGRANWNYIKTIECNADGDIPQDDLGAIRDACNRGVTFWHNPNNIYNYNLSNDII